MEMKFHLILLFFFLHLSSASSSSSLLGREKNLPSGAGVGMAGSAGADDDGKNKTAPGRKIGRISLSNFKGSPASGSEGHRGGSNGVNGEHKSPNGQGGAAVIPIYGAGAANMNRKHHHGTAGRNPICIGLSLSSTALALAVTQLYI